MLKRWNVLHVEILRTQEVYVFNINFTSFSLLLKYGYSKFKITYRSKLWGFCFCFVFLFFFCRGGDTPAACGGSQARG